MLKFGGSALIIMPNNLITKILLHVPEIWGSAGLELLVPKRKHFHCGHKNGSTGLKFETNLWSFN